MFRVSVLLAMFLQSLCSLALADLSYAPEEALIEEGRGHRDPAGPAPVEG